MDSLIVVDNPNFWDVHGILFLIGVALFPRLAMVFATPWGGVLWWVGLIFLPRLQVAILATAFYWDTNPVLVVLSWLFAFGGEVAEKKSVVRMRSSE